MKPAFPMNGARGGRGEDASTHFRCNGGATGSPLTHRGSGSSGCKQVGKKSPEGWSCESEVVNHNALEIGCKEKSWKRGGKREGDKQTRSSNQVPMACIESCLVELEKEGNVAISSSLLQTVWADCECGAELE